MEELKEYIEEQKQKGFSDEQIRKALLDAGWSKKDINKRFGKAKGGGKKGLVIGIIIIIVLITAILAVVFNIGGIGDLFKKSEEIEIKPGPEEKPITWNTYQDDKYSFEAKYPSSVSYLNKDQRAIGDYKGVERRLDLKVDNDSYISIYVWQKEVAEENKYDFETPDYTETTIDEEKSFKGEKKYQNVYFIETYIYKDTYIYQIEYFGTENQKNKTLYNQIVSTFKFLPR